MTVSRGTRLGHFEILARIGAGGMGDVYQATDTKLGRDVAIKTLPEAFASDEGRLARFEREAKLLASLNHPNIAGIYGLEESGHIRFLVLELVEGDTLAERLKRGPIPVEESLHLALQIAEALEAAHERGVIHRDLKPANIKVTPGGQVKVLDFGLAKAMETSPELAPGEGLSNSPTLSMAATQQGMILGTAAYMSPEQAKGMAVDKRTDVFSFGCVLFEMLAGKQAFSGDMVSEILAAIIRGEPDYTLLPSALAPRLRTLIRRCLDKNRKNRWQDVGDLRIEIEQVLAEPAGAVLTPASGVHVPAARRGTLSWIGLCIAAAAIAALAAWNLKPVEPRPVMRFSHPLGEGQPFRNPNSSVMAFSPDGRFFVYNTLSGLQLRSLDGLESRVIPGTETNLTHPVVSPDGQWIAYHSDGQLKKIAVGGGAPITLCAAAANVFGASWEEDGTILFGQPQGIMRVSENGGTPELVVKTEAGEQAHGPTMLPDGRALLFTLASNAAGAARWDTARIIAQSLDSGERKTLLTGGSDTRYAPTGHLIYALGNVLYAVRFDVARLEVLGGPVPIAEGVLRALGAQVRPAAANYGFSKQGTLVYATGAAASENRTLALIDPKGTARTLNARPGAYNGPRVSPDGKYLAVQSTGADGRSAIWVYELSGRSAIRQLTQEGNNTLPVWTPDSRRLTYASDRDGTVSIYSQPIDGSGIAERLTTAEAGTEHWPAFWSPDGRTLAFTVLRGAERDTWTLSMDQPGTPKVFDNTMGEQGGPAFSPDGKWLAYHSSESGTFGIYVQPFPATGVKHRITPSDSLRLFPVWSPDGKTLFYRRGAGDARTLQSVDITAGAGFSFGNEQTLPVEGLFLYASVREYDITPDGRFVVLAAEEAGAAESPRLRINIVINWFEELKERLPAAGNP